MAADAEKKKNDTDRFILRKEDVTINPPKKTISKPKPERK